MQFQAPPQGSLGVKVVLGVLLLSSTLKMVATERILFLLPLATKSHKIFMEPLIDSLAQRHHQVTIVTNEKSAGLNESVVQLIPIEAEDFMSKYPDPLANRRHGRSMAFPLQFVIDGCHTVIRNETFQRLWEDVAKFDLIVVDTLLTNCLDGFVHQSGVPFILMTSMPAPSYVSERVGNFLPPSIIPVLSFRGYGEPDGQMLFWERVKNFLHFLLARVYVNFVILPSLEGVYKEYLGVDVPGIPEIESGAKMIFMNSHFSMNLPRPLLPAVVEIGGIHCREARPLRADLEGLVSKSAAPKGFIYFSAGSLIDMNKAPEQVVQALMASFGNLEQRVLVKWSSMRSANSTLKLVDIPSNVVVGEWFPQQDLLGHENIVLFISHGGLLSMQETVFHGVPVVGIPVGIDQDANVHNAVLQGYAVKVDVDEMSEETLTRTIHTVLTDPRFHTNAQRISKAFRRRPVSALDSAIFWTEYVAQMSHADNFPLHSPASKMTIFQYYSCDTLLFLGVVIIVAIVVVQFTLKNSYRLVRRGKVERQGQGLRRKID